MNASMLTLLVLSAAALPASADQRPNIMLIMMDNVGRDWFGCCGSDEGTTPEIDKLAAEGVRFNTCWATPMCSTSRVELLTGRYGFRTGWHTHHDASNYGGGNFGPQREITFARVLRSAAYATAIAGKWQISNFFEPGQWEKLKEHGFEEYCVWPGGLKDSPGYPRYWDPCIFRDGEKIDAAGRFGPDVFDDYVIDFCRRHRDEPFFVYYPMVLAHVPPVPTPHFNQPEASDRQQFAAMVRYADFQVGRLVRALDELGLRRRTIVIVTTDNGSSVKLVGRMHGQERRGGVGTNLELGINVPLIVNGPNLVPGGRVVGELVDFSDFLPTLAELAEAELPSGVVIDGRSFAPILFGQSRPQPRRWVFSQYYRTRMVGDGRFKLYSTGELFDVSADIDERSDLAGSSNHRAAEAKRRLQAVLEGLPENVDLPFPPRSQSAFRIQAREREQQTRNKQQPCPAAPQLPHGEML